MLQIHQQKGEIVQNVDAGESVREFEAIEQGWLAVDQADVAQMQIAVAAADLSRSAAFVE